jgi:uncharacterized protein YjbI with pentapeptide repeats
MINHRNRSKKSNLLKFAVNNRFSGEVQFTAEIDCAEDASTSIKLGLAVRWAIESRADLSGAYLSGANLSRADLRGAYLSGADLSGADLSGANLSRADLSRADLSRADLRGAYLSGADLSGADLSGANLSMADLSRANLSRADLRGAYLSGADLSGANLSRADLSGANLSRAKDANYAIACTRILPDGDLIGWKKCKNSVIVKLKIPEAAKRSHAFGRKCRGEFADVLEVIGAEFGIGQHDGKTEYRVGQRVTPDSWDENWAEECSHGIHFYITRAEAEAH